jgi:dTDP-4-dehydrorhamnose 3,5-epimerase
VIDLIGLQGEGMALTSDKVFIFDGDIKGVEIKDLVSHPDNRGFFREIFRSNDSVFSGGIFGQWSHSKMEKDVVKAWHYHHLQTDWWYVPIGVIKTVLIDFRKESPTYGAKMEILMGSISESSIENVRSACVRIPPGVLHGCRVETLEAHLFYITSQPYDPNEEGRYPFDASEINYSWGDGVITSERDRRYFVPTAQRLPIDESLESEESKNKLCAVQ